MTEPVSIPLTSLESTPPERNVNTREPEYYFNSEWQGAILPSEIPESLPDLISTGHSGVLAEIEQANMLAPCPWCVYREFLQQRLHDFSWLSSTTYTEDQILEWSSYRVNAIPMNVKTDFLRCSIVGFSDYRKAMVRYLRTHPREASPVCPPAPVPAPPQIPVPLPEVPYPNVYCQEWAEKILSSSDFSRPDTAGCGDAMYPMMALKSFHRVADTREFDQLDKPDSVLFTTGQPDSQPVIITCSQANDQLFSIFDKWLSFFTRVYSFSKITRDTIRKLLESCPGIKPEIFSGETPDAFENSSIYKLLAYLPTAFRQVPSDNPVFSRHLSEALKQSGYTDTSVWGVRVPRASLLNSEAYGSIGTAISKWRDYRSYMVEDGQVPHLVGRHLYINSDFDDGLALWLKRWDPHFPRCSEGARKMLGTDSMIPSIVISYVFFHPFVIMRSTRGCSQEVWNPVPVGPLVWVVSVTLRFDGIFSVGGRIYHPGTFTNVGGYVHPHAMSGSGSMCLGTMHRTMKQRIQEAALVEAFDAVSHWPFWAEPRSSYSSDNANPWRWNYKNPVLHSSPTFASLCLQYGMTQEELDARLSYCDTPLPTNSRTPDDEDSDEDIYVCYSCDATFEDGDDLYVCDYCGERYCEDCGEPHNNGELWLCTHCFENHYQTCESCGYVFREGGGYCESCDRTLCGSCAGDEIHSECCECGSNTCTACSPLEDSDSCYDCGDFICSDCIRHNEYYQENGRIWCHSCHPFPEPEEEDDADAEEEPQSASPDSLVFFTPIVEPVTNNFNTERNLANDPS